MENKFQNLSGYVLSGGRSSRMGKDKAFLKIGRKTLLERAAESLAAICANPVKIVINPAQAAKFQKLAPGFEYVHDVFPERGAVGGIHAALTDCPTECALVLAVDLPLVTTDALARLARIAFRETKAAAVVPQQADGKLQPLCAVYRRPTCLPVVENLIRENASVSARYFLSRISFLSVAQTELSDAEDIFLNVNRPADFASLA